MCGRFNIIDDPGMQHVLRELGFDFHFPTRLNIAPTEAVPVILNGENGLQIHEMRWWLTPSWAPEVSTQYSMFNARSETLETSKAFRGPFRHKRGVMPASSFIEWRREGKAKQPYLIRPVEGAFTFAAIWDQWEKSEHYIESCAMITTDAVDAMNWLHHRMPVMLALHDLEEWLAPNTSRQRLRQLMHSGLPVAMEAVPLTTAINSGRDKGASVLEEVGDPIPISRH